MPDTLRPRPEQLAVLTRFERFAFDLADTINAKPPLKRAAHTFLKTLGASWVYVCTKSLLHVKGLEHLQNLAVDRGVVIASNHRSFFDLYVMSSVLLRNTKWVTGMYFPVRGDYFYDRPDGIVVNGIMSAWAMYPPIMRRPEARAFNEFTVDLMAEILTRPGNVVGMHPEGTRNKTDDPYTLLPMQIGIGQMVHRSRPIVVPMFVLGLGNDFPKQVKSNFDGTGEPITLMFGPPVDFAPLLDEPARLRTYKKITDRLRDVLTDLGQQERRWREAEGWRSLAPETAPKTSPKTT